MFVDNALSHLNENTLRNGDIIAKFFPPKATALTQLMDQGVLETLKRLYRFHLSESQRQRKEARRPGIDRLSKEDQSKKRNVSDGAIVERDETRIFES